MKASTDILDYYFTKTSHHSEILGKYEKHHLFNQNK